VTVRIVRADADEGDQRVDRIKQRRILISRTVVGDLEDVRAKARPEPFVEQLMLLLGLRVAGQQDRHAATGRPQHNAVVVRVRPRPRERPRWAYHAQIEPSLDVRPTSARRDHRDRPAGGSLPDRPRARRGLVEDRDQNAVHPTTPQHAGDTADVVGMKMGDHEPRHRVDAQPAKTPVNGSRFGAGVDDDRLARSHGQHHRVALADIARDHDSAGRRPARGRPTHRHGARHDRQRHDNDELAQRRPNTREQNQHGQHRQC